VSAPSPDVAPELRGPLVRYRVMATVVGVLLVILILIGVPLANFDGSPMWGVFDSTPTIWPDGTTAHRIGEFITTVLGIAHGYLYMIFLVMAFLLSRRARWPISFTLVTLLCGTIPILSFWAERRATARVRAEHPATSAAQAPVS
jgi:integral membrane protein